MNRERLRQAEASFLALYPEGFADPAIQAVRRKHNVGQLVGFAEANLTRVHCNRPEIVADVLLKIVSRSSMISRFEKPRFRDFITALGWREKEALARAVEHRLYGRRRQGFEDLLAMLQPYRIAKWSVLSAVPFYFAPRREVFVKPTTAKRILAYLEVEDLGYHATPSWAFYSGFRRLIADIRKQVAPSLSPTNAALTGFLMMSMSSLGVVHADTGRIASRHED